MLKWRMGKADEKETILVRKNNRSKKTATLTSLEAFEIYYTLGDNRTFQAVADELCVGVAQIRSWANKFKWKEEIEKRDKEMISTIRSRVEKQVIESKVKTLSGLVTMVNNCFTENPDGTITPSITITDTAGLERVVKLINLQTGDDTDRTGIGGGSVQLIIKGKKG